jgi:hypothetical protein
VSPHSRISCEYAAQVPPVRLPDEVYGRSLVEVPLWASCENVGLGASKPRVEATLQARLLSSRHNVSYANFGEPPAPAVRPHRDLTAPLWGHAAPGFTAGVAVIGMDRVLREHRASLMVMNAPRHIFAGSDSLMLDALPKGVRGVRAILQGAVVPVSVLILIDFSVQPVATFGYPYVYTYMALFNISDDALAPELLPAEDRPFVNIQNDGWLPATRTSATWQTWGPRCGLRSTW